MDRKIFYFTGTGNSLSVANALADGGTTYDVAATEAGAYSAESIGFVFPVYCYNIPDIAKDFMKYSTFKADYFWAVAVCGGAQGNALAEVEKLLKEKDEKLSYSATVILPDTSVVIKSTAKENAEKLEKEPEVVEKIKKDISNKTTNSVPTATKYNTLIGGLSWFGMKTLLNGKRGAVNAEKCIACGTCARLCPAGNITLNEYGKPRFFNNCSYCFGCMHFCPKNAISFGSIHPADGKQYHHPKVSAQGLIEIRNENVNRSINKNKETTMDNYIISPSTEPNACQKFMIERKYGMFLHFGINTFNDTEWSNGKLAVSSFNPTALDVDSWIRTAYEAGMNYVIVLTKHHDGFCYWKTDTTDYGIKDSPCKADIIEEARKACDKYGLKLGLYYSLWDRHEKCYKNAKQYAEFMRTQIKELLGGKYGEICELWLDGGWERRNSQWEIPELYKTVKALQPKCACTVNGTIGKYNSKGGCIEKYLPENYKKNMPIKYFPCDFRLLDPFYTKVDDPKIYTHNFCKYYLPFEATICVRNMRRWFWGKGYNEERMLTPKYIAYLYSHFVGQDNLLVVNTGPTTEGKIQGDDAAVLLAAADLIGIRRKI